MRIYYSGSTGEKLYRCRNGVPETLIGFVVSIMTCDRMRTTKQSHSRLEKGKESHQ